MPMFLLDELYVAYIEDYNEVSYREYTKIFTSKEEAEHYQGTEKRDYYSMSYKILPLKDYLELIYVTGKEDGEYKSTMDYHFHFG